MAVFKYHATSEREDIEELGTVVAQDEEAAQAKLRELGYKHVSLKRLHGFSAFLKRFVADVR